MFVLLIWHKHKDDHGWMICHGKANFTIIQNSYIECRLQKNVGKQHYKVCKWVKRGGTTNYLIKQEIFTEYLQNIVCDNYAKFQKLFDKLQGNLVLSQ